MADNVHWFYLALGAALFWLWIRWDRVEHWSAFLTANLLFLGAIALAGIQAVDLVGAVEKPGHLMQSELYVKKMFCFQAVFWGLATVVALLLFTSVAPLGRAAPKPPGSDPDLAYRLFKRRQQRKRREGREEDDETMPAGERPAEDENGPDPEEA